MPKLGFVVGHPTQFETPFYCYVADVHGSDKLCVYYYNFSGEGIKDRELGAQLHNKWGIDLLSGYTWENILHKPWRNSKRILRENQYVVLNGYTSSLAWILLLTACIFRKKIGMRMDTVPWNNQGLWKKGIKSVFFFILSLVVDIFWVTGTKSQEFLLSIGIPKSRIKIFSYVIDSQWFKRESMISDAQRTEILKTYGISPGKNVIMTVVKLVKRETPEDLIKAFGLCLEDKITLVIVGDGDLRSELEENTKKWANNKEVVFTGYVPYRELPKLYGIADLYVHTSENEPWGVSVQEAMACGLPVIASHYVGSAYDLLHEGRNGMIYSHGNIQQLANCILKMLTVGREEIREENNQILAGWDYSSTWKEVERYIDQKHSTSLISKRGSGKTFSSE